MEAGEQETIYIWRKKFGSMTPDDAKRLKTLECENAKLKKMLADKLLEIDVLKDINAEKSGHQRSRLVSWPPLRWKGSREDSTR